MRKIRRKGTEYLIASTNVNLLLSRVLDVCYLFMPVVGYTTVRNNSTENSSELCWEYKEKKMVYIAQWQIKTLLPFDRVRLLINEIIDIEHIAFLLIRVSVRKAYKWEYEWKSVCNYATLMWIRLERRYK